MAELEKVIRGLEHCLAKEPADRCVKCPYLGRACSGRLMEDALALLKAQDADHDLLDRVRRGEVLKHKGGGVVIFNEKWYMAHRDREAPRKQVPRVFAAEYEEEENG